MQILEIESTGSLSHPHIVGDIKFIKLSDKFNISYYGKHIYIKVNKIVDLTFIDNGHQNLSDYLVILSDEENIVFEQIKIERLEEEDYYSWGFSGIAFFKPIKNITKIFNIDLKNVRGDYKEFSIKIINPKKHSYIIDNTFNLNYHRIWSIKKNDKNQVVKFKIKDSEEEYELKRINSPFERFSFELEIKNDYLELESFNIEFDKQRKNQLYEYLLLEYKIPFFPLNFDFLNLTIDSNLANNYKNYLPYFYISQCNVTIKTQYDILFNIVFQTSYIKTINKKPFFFECHLVDSYTYYRIKEKNKFYNIENDYLLENIPFESYKRNLFPNFLNNVFKKLYQPSSLLKLSSYIVMLFFLIIINSIMFEQKDMLPTDPVSTQTYLFDTMKRQHKDVNIESRESWSYVEGYQQYNPFLYAFELALPISIGQNQTWAPIFDEKRKYMNIYYYMSKIISKLLWFLIAYNIYRLWDKKKND